MMDLGPTGRTKHTDAPTPREILVDTRTMTAAQLRMANRLLVSTIVTVVVALVVLLIYTKIDEHMSAPERERRIDACATAMASESAREAVVVPIPQCEPLSASERREAAYVYAQREGLL